MSNKNLSTTKMRNAEGFGKPDSMALKGLAVLMMIFFHCFANEKTVTTQGVNFFPFDYPFINTVRLYLKICVCIFAFISGYGLYQSFRKNNDEAPGTTAKWVISRIIKTMSGFWFIFLLNLGAMLVLHGASGTPYFKKGTVQGILNLFLDGMGLSALFGTPTVTVVWWYMGAALFFIIMLPAIYRAAERYGYFVVMTFVILFPRVMNIGWTGSRNPYSFLLIFILGMCFSRYDLFAKLEEIRILKKTKGNAEKLLQFTLLFGALLASAYIFLKLPWSVIWEFQFALCPVIFILFSKRYILTIPGLRQMLIYFGKHSMNMYLIHTLLKNKYFTDFVYSPKYFLLIPVLLTVMSLGCSIVFEWLKKILRYDRGIDSMSNWLCTKIDRITAE